MMRVFGKTRPPPQRLWARYVSEGAQLITTTDCGTALAGSVASGFSHIHGIHPLLKGCNQTTITDCGFRETQRDQLFL